MRLVLALACLLAACASSAESRCPDLCTREAKCAEELEDEQLKIDRSECTEACNQLEHSDDGKILVDEHVQCESRATTCAELLACQ